mmetsp:Transcript_4679/g.13563  ORF Transcript_4679/g.13563 Transcript_4679/m.13563 type:complete len:205 (-) Transcript_4679:197-811(-)
MQASSIHHHHAAQGIATSNDIASEARERGRVRLARWRCASVWRGKASTGEGCARARAVELSCFPRGAGTWLRACSLCRFSGRPAAGVSFCLSPALSPPINSRICANVETVAGTCVAPSAVERPQENHTVTCAHGRGASTAESGDGGDPLAMRGDSPPRGTGCVCRKRVGGHAPAVVAYDEECVRARGARRPRIARIAIGGADCV